MEAETVRCEVLSTDTIAKWIEKYGSGSSLLDQKLDPEGHHVVVINFLHNDHDIRCMVLVKTIGAPEPVTLWMDVPATAFLDDVQVAEFTRVPDDDEEDGYRVEDVSFTKREWRHG